MLPAHLREKINARVNPSLEVTSTDKESLRKKVPAKVRTEAAALLAGKQHRDVHYKVIEQLVFALWDRICYQRCHVYTLSRMLVAFQSHMIYNTVP